MKKYPLELILNVDLNSTNCETTPEGYGITPDWVFEKYKILAFRWGLGRGKTETAKRFITANPTLRVLVIVPRKSLAANATYRFNKEKSKDSPARFVNYEKAKEKDFETRNLVVCIPSLPKVMGVFDVVIIDEIESVLSMLNAPELIKGRKAQKLYKHLKKSNYSGQLT